MTFCPMCSGHASFIGFLGDRANFRCRDCGADFSHYVEDDIEEEEESEPDAFDDAFALASAGFGTDEDYGCFGDY